MQKYIYVLKLEGEKWLIHFSEEKSEAEIMSECEIYYDYAKKYKPLVLEEIIPLMHYVDIDTQVKWYMHLYGYLNVKGGSYTEDPLPAYLEKTLIRELVLLEKQQLEWSAPFTEILNTYEYREYTSLEEIDSEISKINMDLEKYNLEKAKMEKVCFFKENGIKKHINTSNIDMNWLYEHCCLKTFQYESGYSNNSKSEGFHQNFKSKNVEKYKKILQCLKHLYCVFEEFDLFEKHSVKKSVELKYPHFIFDTFLYHRPTLNTAPRLSDVHILCKTFQFMWDVVANMSTELEFDVLSYGSGFLWKVPRILYVLGKKRKEMERNVVLI